MKAPIRKLSWSAKGVEVRDAPIAWPRARKVLVKSMLGSGHGGAAPSCERRKLTWLVSVVGRDLDRELAEHRLHVRHRAAADDGAVRPDVLEAVAEHRAAVELALEIFEVQREVEDAGSRCRSWVVAAAGGRRAADAGRERAPAASAPMPGAFDEARPPRGPAEKTGLGLVEIVWTWTFSSWKTAHARVGGPACRGSCVRYGARCNERMRACCDDCETHGRGARRAAQGRRRASGGW